MNKETYINNIPQELKDCKQWLWFKTYHNKDKKGNAKAVKIPISPITCEANEWNKKENWTDFETALDGLEKSGCDGLSFVLTEDDPYVCIDLDNVKENFEDAKDIVSDFVETYKETSISENGLHIFAKGSIPKNINNQIDHFEMYKSNKCIAMTGNVVGDCKEIQDNYYKLNIYYKKYALKETIREQISYYKSIDSDVPDIEDILKAIYMTNRKGRELFRGKNQQRFTRAKTIGANYNEERIKNRILNKDKELGNIIDIKNSEKAKSSKGYENWATKHNLKTAASTLVEIRNKGFNSMEELERGISRISIEKNDLKREFDKLSLEQKRIKEVVKHIQICISKREHYEGYRKNPNDKIYMIMNRKDVEAYQKSYEEIGIFLKQFPHLRHVVLGELKTKSGKNIFKKLNEHSKELQAKQEEIIKEYNSLAVQYDELEHLKNNMNEYLGRDKVEKKKESIIHSIKSRKTEDKEMPKEKKEIRKEFER